MGYQVYWANGRWQGYGVPAYCDHKGCKEEIDRGLGYRHEKDDKFCPDKFVCKKHSSCNLKNVEIDLGKEHPEWLRHVLTDESWKQWRKENPKIAENYKRVNNT